MPRRILLIVSDPPGTGLPYSCLDHPEYRIHAQASAASDLVAVIAGCVPVPDLLIIHSDDPDDRLLATIREVCSTSPLPVALFTRQHSRATIRKALEAGVSSYVVDESDPRRLGAILDVAVTRFHANERLKSELQATRASLAERKTVERAKGILMKQKGLDESRAYNALRKLAMDSNLRIGQAAENVIAVAEILNR